MPGDPTPCKERFGDRCTLPPGRSVSFGCDSRRAELGIFAPPPSGWAADPCPSCSPGVRSPACPTRPGVSGYRRRFGLPPAAAVGSLALPKREHAEAKDLLRNLAYAPSRADAVKARQAFGKRYGRWYPKAVKVLEDDGTAWSRSTTSPKPIGSI